MDRVDHNNRDMRYIARWSCKGLQGYVVRVYWYPDGKAENIKWHSKLFAYRDYSNEDDALDHAIQYREQWFKEKQLVTFLRLPGSCFNFHLPSNNTSGILGVGRSEQRGRSGRIEPVWQTTYPGLNGKPVNRKFSIGLHGEVGALRRAVEERLSGVLTFLDAQETPISDTDYELIPFYEDILANLAEYRDPENESPIMEIVRNPEITGTTKLNEIYVRVGQQRFRREVLESFDFRCAVTGSTALIRASHIKPWRVASHNERLDPANGLALSPVYDAAFDLGLISFTPDGRILVSRKFKDNATSLGISGSERLRTLMDEHQKYLDWHRKHVYVGDEV